MLDPAPERRATAAEMLQHPWLSQEEGEEGPDAPRRGVTPGNVRRRPEESPERLPGPPPPPAPAPAAAAAVAVAVAANGGGEKKASNKQSVPLEPKQNGNAQHPSPAEPVSAVAAPVEPASISSAAPASAVAPEASTESVPAPAELVRPSTAKASARQPSGQEPASTLLTAHSNGSGKQRTQEHQQQAVVETSADEDCQQRSGPSPPPRYARASEGGGSQGRVVGSNGGVSGYDASGKAGHVERSRGVEVSVQGRESGARSRDPSVRGGGYDACRSQERGEYRERHARKRSPSRSPSPVRSKQQHQRQRRSSSSPHEQHRRRYRSSPSRSPSPEVQRRQQRPSLPSHRPDNSRREEIRSAHSSYASHRHNTSRHEERSYTECSSYDGDARSEQRHTMSRVGQQSEYGSHRRSPDDRREGRDGRGTGRDVSAEQRDGRGSRCHSRSRSPDAKRSTRRSGYN